MRRGLALLVSLVCAGGLLEGGARALLPPPAYHRSPLLLDRVLGFRHVPDHVHPWVSPVDPSRSHEVRFGPDGFRGRPLPDAAPPPGTRRLAFFGDSFVVAEAVPEAERMTERVERGLVEAGQAAEVYALGTVDYGTGQELLLLDRLGPRLRPDTVVLVVYPPNDVLNNALALAGVSPVSPGDAIRPYVTVRDGGRLETRWAMPLRSFLRRHLASFAHAELGLAPPDLGRVDPRPVATRVALGLPPREYLEVFRDHAPDDPWEQAWQQTEALLRAFRDRCDALGARLVVVVVPEVDQVLVTPRRIGFEIEARAHGRALAEWVDWNLPEQRLAGFFAAEEIEAYALLEPLRAAARAGAEVYTRDLHLAAAGHAVAARVLLDALAAPDARRDAGGALESALAPEALDAPVAADPAQDPAWLDLRESPHPGAFSDGWIDWRPRGPAHPGGWRLGARGLVAVRGGPGPLVLRGRALVPVVVDVALLGGGPRRRKEVVRAGPFEMRLPLEPAPARSQDGHVAAIVSTGPAIGRVILQQIGFEEARATAD